MVLVRTGGARPLEERRQPLAAPGAGQVLLRVEACGVCRTDLHVVDGELEPHLPTVPGHEIVGRVLAMGPGVQSLAVGGRVGVPWLGWSCGACRYCRAGRENLCDRARFTGWTLPGGYATHVVANADWCIPLEGIERTAAELAPLLCAGLIGWRALRAAGPARRLGIFGFGAAASLVAQVACLQDREVFAFTRPGDADAQAFALEMGATWAAGSDSQPREPLDAAIVFAPAGELVPRALSLLDKGGRVVCGGIHMSDIPSFPYRLLWEERQVVSVANLTRADAVEFFDFVRRYPLRTVVTRYPLTHANQALDDLRHGRLRGAAVIEPCPC